MSGIHRDDRPALVVLALLVASIVVASLSGLYARHEASHPIACYTPTIENGDEAQEYDDICPGDHIFFGDGWAQWVMAGFAIVATGVSWRALYLLRQTFIETKRTADAAVGDQRPWVSLDLLSVKQTFGISNYASAVMRFRLDNHGKTPAVQGRLFLNFVRTRGALDPRFDSFMTDCAREYADSVDRQRSTVVFPGPGVPFIRSIDEHDNAKPVSVANSYHVFAAFFYRATQGQPEPMHIGRAYFIDMKSGDMESDDFTFKQGDDDRAFWSIGVVSIA